MTRFDFSIRPDVFGYGFIVTPLREKAVDFMNKHLSHVELNLAMAPMAVPTAFVELAAREGFKFCGNS